MVKSKSNNFMKTPKKDISVKSLHSKSLISNTSSLSNNKSGSLLKKKKF